MSKFACMYVCVTFSLRLLLLLCVVCHLQLLTFLLQTPASSFSFHFILSPTPLRFRFYFGCRQKLLRIYYRIPLQRLWLRSNLRQRQHQRQLESSFHFTGTSWRFACGCMYLHMYVCTQRTLEKILKRLRKYYFSI